ncbi:MAG: hypothetical protein ACYDDO_02830 [Acidiferrobacterales bacterium]
MSGPVHMPMDRPDHGPRNSLAVLYRPIADDATIMACPTRGAGQSGGIIRSFDQTHEPETSGTARLEARNSIPEILYQ